MNRRTTVAAPIEDLATLEAEAHRRGVSTTTVIAEAISEKAAALRSTRRPRIGIGHSRGRSSGAAVLTAEPVAEPAR